MLLTGRMGSIRVSRVGEVPMWHGPEPGLGSNAASDDARSAPSKPIPLGAGRIRRHVGPWLCLGDILLLVLAWGVSLAMAVMVKEGLLHGAYSLLDHPEAIAQRLVPYALMSAFLIIWFASRGHYTQRLLFWAEMREIVSGVALVALLDVFVQYASKDQFSRLWLVQNWLIATVLLIFGRQLTKWLLARAGIWQIRTLVLGRPDNVEEVAGAFVSEPGLGYHVVGMVDSGDRVPDWASIEAACRRCRAGFLVLAFDPSELEGARDLIAELSTRQLPFAMVSPIRGIAVYGLAAQHFFSHDVVLLQPRNNLDRPIDRSLKRCIDVIGASLGLVLLGPLLIAIGLLIRADGGPALYGHRRVGMHGRPFQCLKFRTMVQNADRKLHELLARDPEAAAQWKREYKLRNDPRITRFGQFLRKSSIDELPQLINVLRGEMSLVGPRPIVEGELAYYGDDARFYLQVRPGITGLWQVSGRNDVSYDRRVALDAWYVRNWSVWHDLAIICRTVPTVLRRRGVY
jgi:undecaprenyl-phosphate galactose phosphotransferase